MFYLTSFYCIANFFYCISNFFIDITTKLLFYLTFFLYCKCMLIENIQKLLQLIHCINELFALKFNTLSIIFIFFLPYPSTLIYVVDLFIDRSNLTCVDVYLTSPCYSVAMKYSNFTHLFKTRRNVTADIQVNSFHSNRRCT